METRRGTQGNFQLAGFPKEFERNIWEELDKRYVLILLIIWVISFTFTYFMSSRDWRLSEAEMEKIKREALAKVYGKIVVETEPTTTTEAPEAVTVEEGGGAEQTSEVQKEEGKKIIQESAAQQAQRRRATRASLAAKSRQMERQVASSGILGVITAGGGVGEGSTEYGDVLGEAGGGGVTDIGSVVAGTGGIAAASAPGQRTRVAKGISGGAGGEGEGIDNLIKGGTVSASSGFRRKGGITIAAADLGVSGRASGAASRDPESLIRVVNKNKSGVEYCIQRALKINPSLKGRIDVEIEISPSGRVIAARIIKSTLKDKSLERCILRKLKRWRGFGKIDPSYGNLKLRLPFIV